MAGPPAFIGPPVRPPSHDPNSNHGNGGQDHDDKLHGIERALANHGAGHRSPHATDVLQRLAAMGAHLEPPHHPPDQG